MPKIPGIERYVIYTRVSTDEQGEVDLSIPRQRRICEEWIKERAGILVGYYSDEGYSSSTIERPDLQRLIADAAKDQFDSVCVYASDRMARGEDTPSVVRYLLKCHNVAIVSATEAHYAGDELGDVIQRIVHRLTGTVFLHKLRQDVKAGLRQVAEEGRRSGIAPYGYRPKPRIQISPTKSRGAGWDIVASEAAVVRRIFDLYIEGVTINKIAASLNDQSLPCPCLARLARQNKAMAGYWTTSTIARILDNPRYCGRMDDDGRAGKYEPIISTDTFDAVQQLRSSRPKFGGAKSTQGMFVGLLRCPRCGSALIYTWAANHNKRYGCASKQRAKNKRREGWPADTYLVSCEGFYIAESVVLVALVRAFEDAIRLHGEPIVPQPERSKPPADHTEKLAAELRQLDDARKRAIELHVTHGVTTSDELKSQLDKIEERRRQIIAITDVAAPKAAALDPVVIRGLVEGILSPYIPITTKRDALAAGIVSITPQLDRETVLIAWRDI